MKLKTTEPIVGEYRQEFYGLNISSRYLYRLCDTSGNVLSSTMKGTADDLDEVRCSDYDHNYACFHELMRQIGISDNPQKITVRYHINKNNSPEAIRYFCNYCWMNKKQLTKHINQVKRIIPDGWSYKFLETDVLENDCYFIEFEFNLTKLINPKKILFILTWVRHCCEFSGNYALYDAYLLKDTARKGLAPGELMKYPEMELFHITNKAFRNYFHSDQSIGGFFVMPKENGVSELKKRLNSIKDRSYPETIKQLFNGRHLSNEIYSKVFVLSSQQKETTSLGWLNDPNKFITERLPIHIKNWEIMKQSNLIEK